MLCINPTCPQPKNAPNALVCQACGSKLLLNGKYRVGKSLGQGGFGATYLAANVSLPGCPLCVIKQLRPASSVPEVFRMAKELFEREAKTLGRIGNHPQVPTLLDFFEEGQQFYLVQEYVKGHNLQQEVKENGPFSEAGTKQFLSEIMPMMQYIHSQHVIHRDIKPANLIRREQDKKLVLIDFGAVKNQVNPEQSNNSSDQTALTQFAIGTPGFAPPEQMAMRPVYASDIYAVGVTCIYLLTGKSPKELDYDPNTGEMLWEKHVHISPHFASVLKKMLESSVKHRYQSSEEVLKALDLEPYLDSLAQGLAVKGNTSPPPPPHTFGRIKSDPTAGKNEDNSHKSRLAMAIRARRDRMTPDTGFSSVTRGNFPTPPSQTASKHSLGNKGEDGNNPKKKMTVRIDADTVLKGFQAGRKDFGQQNLAGVNLPQANLPGVIFHESRLSKANFQAAILEGADFGKANLTQANLRDAKLGRAYFSYTNLEGADLRGADLSYAHMNYANLTGANLCGANLTNARISDEQLAQAKTNWSTILPNGKRGLFG